MSPVGSTAVNIASDVAGEALDLGEPWGVSIGSDFCVLRLGCDPGCESRSSKSISRSSEVRARLSLLVSSVFVRVGSDEENGSNIVSVSGPGRCGAVA